LDTDQGFDETDYIASFDTMYNFDFIYETGYDPRQQYEMLYFEESMISVTWTNQHGTGNKKLNTQMVMQFICDTFPRASSAATNDFGVGPSGTITGTDFADVNRAITMRKHGLRVELYNGGNTNTPDEPNSIQTDGGASTTTTYQNNHNNRRGRRESEEFYSLCKSRSQQYGLFHSDQDLQGDSQIYTRQNPGGTRRGLECPEERDYYPWWNPSPFHDIAIITPDVKYCEDYIAPESQNVKMKYQCVKETVSASDGPTTYLLSATAVEYNLNQTWCEMQAGHKWEGFQWDGEEPECVESYWSKANHVGNVDGTKRGGRQANYDWYLPTYDDLVNKHYCYPYSMSVTDSSDSTDDSAGTFDCVRMMVRLRYNISTMDYDPYMTDSTQDEDDNNGVISPIQNNPTVDVGVYAQGLRLAINTAQTGRTFQDNSHTFLVCKRPSNADWKNNDVINVNVRGKRGNIVQTFPATEYDFEPQHISILSGQCMHFQWTGSNTHNTGSPGGDGQTGDAGEGQGGTDRFNIVQSLAMDQSYPVTYDQFTGEGENFFDYVDCYHPLQSGIGKLASEDAQIVLGTAGFYRSVAYARTQITNHQDAGVLDVLLNNASASFRQGLICCITSGPSGNGVIAFSFISTRNNNFTNRCQKLKIEIKKEADPGDEW
jgi:plastocyanin